MIKNYVRKLMLVCLVLWSYKTLVYAQHLLPVTQMITPDTVLNLAAFNTTGGSTGDWIMHGKGNAVYILIQNLNSQKDSIYLLRIQLQNKEMERFGFYLRGYSKELADGINDFDIQYNQLLLLFNRDVLLLSLDNTAGISLTRIQDKVGYEHIQFAGEHQFMVWRNYPIKSHNGKIETNRVSLVQQHKGKITKQLKPETGLIYLAYFKPYQVIDACDGALLVGNNLRLQAMVYNPQLSVQSQLSTHHLTCAAQTIDTAAVYKLAAISHNNTETLMNFLAPQFTQTAAVADGYFLLNRNKILIRYNTATDTGLVGCRYFVCCYYSEINAAWKCSDTSYVYQIPKGGKSNSEVLTAENYIDAFWPEPSLFLSQYTVVLKSGSPVIPYGLTQAAYRKQRSLYFKSHEPVPLLYVYKNNF